MNISTYIYPRNSIFLFLLVTLFLPSCSKSATSHATSDFDKLCKIYEEVVTQNIDLSTKEMKLTEKVEKELPDFMDPYFNYIESINSDKRYPFIKKLAEEKTLNPWDCTVMKDYYATEFNQPKDSSKDS